MDRSVKTNAEEENQPENEHKNDAEQLYAVLTRTLFGPPREELDLLGLRTVRKFVAENAESAASGAGGAKHTDGAENRAQLTQTGHSDNNQRDRSPKLRGTTPE